MKDHKEISVLVLCPYMKYPPIDGEVRRMLYPAMHLLSEDRIHFHYMYYAFNENESEQCSEFLHQFPLIIDSTSHVVSENFQLNGVRKPKSLNQKVWNSLNRDFLNRVLEEVKSKTYDIIQIEHSYFAWLVPHIRLACSAKIVLDCQNLEWVRYKRWLSCAIKSDRKWVESAYHSLKQWDEQVLPWFDAIYCSSPVEKQMIEEMFPEAITYYVPSGASDDDDRYDPGSQRNERPRDLLFTGSMDYFPDRHALLWFLAKVYPLILEELPGTTLDIVGSGMPDTQILRHIQGNRNITFLGEVEDEVPVFHQGKVFISPSWIGAGVCLKNPTAWIAGLPVVATSLSVEGLEYRDGEDLLIGDTPELFAEQTIRLLRDTSLREQIAKHANQRYQERYSEKQICDSWKNAYYSTVEKSRLTDRREGKIIENGKVFLTETERDQYVEQNPLEWEKLQEAMDSVDGFCLSDYDRNLLWKILDEAPASECKMILEVGCGAGQLVRALAHFYPEARVIGIDPYLKEWWHTVEASDANWEVRLGNGQDIEYPADTFDLVVSIAAFEHISLPEECLKEIKRVLKPGGLFITNFGPVWSGIIGHHCGHSVKDTVGKIPPWGHLYLSYDEMLQHLKGSERIDSEQAKKMCDKIYKDSFINRVDVKRFEEAFANCGMEIIEKTQGLLKNRLGWITGESENELTSDILKKLKGRYTEEELFVSAYTLVMKKR